MSGSSGKEVAFYLLSLELVESLMLERSLHPPTLKLRWAGNVEK
jgi:hypothetical protein